MNDKIATSALMRYFEKDQVAKSAQGTKKSALSTLVKMDALKHFDKPQTLYTTVTTTQKRKRDGSMVDYSESEISNWMKTPSKVGQHLTDDEKITMVDKFYEEKGDAFSLNKKIRHNKEQKLKAFDVYIVDEYKAFNGVAVMKYNEGNIGQKMNERQTRAYEPCAKLPDKLLDLEENLRDQLGLGVRKVRDYQFVVAGLIFLLAERNRQLDIVFTQLQDGEDVNVVLQTDKEGKPTEIFIKETNKTQEPSVLLPFKHKRLIAAVHNLMNFRKENNSTHLFPNQKDAPFSCNWFGEKFKKAMEKLDVGENLTSGVFRMAYGIHLSENHDGTAISEKHIEDAMGHSWHVHQRRYNLTALQNNNDEDLEQTSDEE
ncbi:hypothetical protein HK097_008123 [Rhizophlyctis rosea]|uniref:Uncharacterized protein n=1 Tax=Rhizophlyctis rosea TaxID=64517 RepID=A0AAD5X5H0_9FUNG|nr:hypothetical protein HK097_008123 [Rhizophlyctis rosea]